MIPRGTRPGVETEAALLADILARISQLERAAGTPGPPFQGGTIPQAILVLPSGADGGWRLGAWTSSSSFMSLATGNMAGTEYVVLSDGSSTFIGAGAGGTTYVRGGDNADAYQLAISSSAATFANDLRVNGHTYLGASKVYSWSADANTYMWNPEADKIGLVTGGGTKLLLTTSQNISYVKMIAQGDAGGGSDGQWFDMQLRAQTVGTTQSIPTNSTAGLAFHVDAWNIAPSLSVYGPIGQRLNAVNSSNSAYIPIAASAFTVISTIRAKEEIEWVEDDAAIKMAEEFLLAKFRPKVRPQSVRPSSKFADINDRWVAGGHSPLTCPDREKVAADHDCAVDPCSGTEENPCPITVNDTRRYGGLAEWTGEVTPEMVTFDEEETASSIDVDQVATIALGAVGALSRRLEAALDRIDALEQRLAD